MPSAGLDQMIDLSHESSRIHLALTSFSTGNHVHLINCNPDAAEKNTDQKFTGRA